MEGGLPSGSASLESWARLAVASNQAEPWGGVLLCGMIPTCYGPVGVAGPLYGAAGE